MRRILLAIAAALSVVAAAFAAQAPGSTDPSTPSAARAAARVDLSRLRPSVAEAPNDRAVIYRDGCHASQTATTPRRGCIYGKRDGRRTVVAIGDSHMAQWWAPLDRVARAHGARLVWFTKSACGAATVTARLGGGPYASCDTWRRRAITRINALPRVDVVVMASSYGKTLLRPGTNRAVPPAGAPAAWTAATLRTVHALDGTTRHVVVIRNTPGMKRNQPRCLAATHGAEAACARARSAALPLPWWRAEQRAAAESPRLVTADFSNSICGPAVCDAVTWTYILRWRDDHHLTQTFATTLTPGFDARLRGFLR